MIFGIKKIKAINNVSDTDRHRRRRSLHFHSGGLQPQIVNGD